jgi:putative ABC transport system permease protein
VDENHGVRAPRFAARPVTHTAPQIDDLLAVLIDATRRPELAPTRLSALAAFVVGLTIATAAILVAGRMAAQIRQVGTLKAVGVTPGQVTGVLLADYLTAALLATAVGLVAGTRRPGRFIANTFGLTIGIALVIARLALRTGVQTFGRQGLSLNDPDPISLAATAANLDRLSTLGFTITAFLIALAVINAIIAAVFSAHDSARNHAILRTLGTTPGQTVTAFLVAHPAACLLACATGIPLGIALYNAIRGQTLGPIDLTPLTYIAVSLTALLLYAAIAVTPARLLARRPVTPQLAYE